MKGRIFMFLFALPFFGVGMWMGYSAGANLVVLRADPLASISDTRLIDLVIQRGEVLQPHTLIRN